MQPRISPFHVSLFEGFQHSKQTNYLATAMQIHSVLWLLEMGLKPLLYFAHDIKRVDKNN